MNLTKTIIPLALMASRSHGLLTQSPFGLEESNIDTVKIYVQFFRPTTNLNINARMSRVVAYESLNTKKKSSWVIPKVVAVACESFSSQRLSQILKGVFTKAVVTRASRLREWSQGEPRLWGRGCFYTCSLRDQPPHHIIYHF